MNILITGVAGFIGFHLAKRLLKKRFKVIGIDNLSSYYDVNLKKNRLKEIQSFKNFSFVKADVHNKNLMKKLGKYNFEYIINLAAQAGVRHSFKDPYSYIDSNIMGQLNILEIVKKKNVKNFIYASSSSVYGGNKELPFSVKHRVDNPVSLYAASKKSCELITECYSRLFKIKSIGLRFFTVYGPWGRPDMATFIFTKKILEKKKINIFNFGKMKRDFTYIDDIIDGIEGSLNFKSKKDWFHKIYNLGNSNSENLLEFINIIESNLGIEAKKNFLPMQPGDVQETFADISESKRDLKFFPKTRVQDGIPKFIDWYKKYYLFK